MTLVTHIFVCGATRSGKSEAEVSRLVPLAKEGNSAIVLLDPPGTLAAKMLLQLDWLGLTRRVVYDRLADTDKVIGYDWLAVSAHTDPLQRDAENDERVREFASVLLRRRGIQDTAFTPLIEEGLLAALRLYLHQRTSVPLAWIANVFTLGSPQRSQLLLNCTEPQLVRKFHDWAALNPAARRTETGPAERILRAVCESPAFRVRSAGASFDFDRLLDERGILILDGSSQGNLSRDAASVMMGAVILKVIHHCRTGGKSRVILVLDEAVNANLIGVHESRAIAEAAKWNLEFHVIAQDPFNFPNEEIRNNILQNCGRHEWFRQGSPAAARLAAEDIATPLLDPLQVHHTEVRTRTTDAGFDRVQTTNHAVTDAAHGQGRRRTTSWQTVLWPRKREVKESQDRYTALQDQILLKQKELMGLKVGYRFVRDQAVTPTPEYVAMVRDPWSAMDGGDAAAGPARLSDIRREQVLAAMKQRPIYRVPAVQTAVRLPKATGLGAAERLSRGESGDRSSDVQM